MLLSTKSSTFVKVSLTDLPQFSYFSAFPGSVFFNSSTLALIFSAAFAPSSAFPVHFIIEVFDASTSNPKSLSVSERTDISLL